MVRRPPHNEHFDDLRNAQAFIQLTQNLLCPIGDQPAVVGHSDEAEPLLDPETGGRRVGGVDARDLAGFATGIQHVQDGGLVRQRAHAHPQRACQVHRADPAAVHAFHGHDLVGMLGCLRRLDLDGQEDLPVGPGVVVGAEMDGQAARKGTAAVGRVAHGEGRGAGTVFPNEMARKAARVVVSSQSPCWLSTSTKSKPQRAAMPATVGEPMPRTIPRAGEPASSLCFMALIIVNLQMALSWTVASSDQPQIRLLDELFYPL